MVTGSIGHANGWHGVQDVRQELQGKTAANGKEIPVPVRVSFRSGTVVPSSLGFRLVATYGATDRAGVVAGWPEHQSGASMNLQQMQLKAKGTSKQNLPRDV
jgi:hypothetical protein